LKIENSAEETPNALHTIVKALEELKKQNNDVFNVSARKRLFLKDQGTDWS